MRNNGGQKWCAHGSTVIRMSAHVGKWQTSGIDQMRNTWDYGEALSHSMRRCDKYTNTVEHIQLLKGVRTGQGVGNARTGQGVKNVRMSQSVKNVKIVKMWKS